MTCSLKPKENSSFIPIKSSMKLYVFPLKKVPVLLCPHTIFMTIK